MTLVAAAGPCRNPVITGPQALNDAPGAAGPPKWSASEVPRGLSGGCQCGRLMVVFVLLVSLCLFVPFDPGQQVLEIGSGGLPFERSVGGVVALLEGGEPVLDLVEVG